MSKTSLGVAMSLPDDQVSKPSKKQPVSLSSAIAALGVGDATSKVIELSPEKLACLSDVKKGLSDSASSSMRNAKTRAANTGAQYTIETAVTITGSGAVFALAIIKRTA